MAKEKWPPFIRFIVATPGQSGLCAQFTPAYFNERQKTKAKMYAAKIGSQVYDSFTGKFL